MRSKVFKNYSLNTACMVLGILYCFPIIYMVWSSFRPEMNIAPPSWNFDVTLDNYRAVINDEFFFHLRNSLLITSATVLLTILFGVPAAYALVFGRLKKAASIYNWFITTTLLPAVAVILPIYLILNFASLMDSIIVLILLYTAAGIPLMVWMMKTFLEDVPYSIIEAADTDGSSRWRTFFVILLPIIRAGLVSTAMLVFITTWNEFLFAVSFSFTKSPTLPVFMNRFLTQQGLFWGKMSAVGTIIIIVPVATGFFAQKSLIAGLTSGAVKG